MGRLDVERLDVPDRHTLIPEIVECVRLAAADGVHDHVAGIGTDHETQGGEPAECLQVKTRIRIDDTGEGAGGQTDCGVIYRRIGSGHQ